MFKKYIWHYYHYYVDLHFISMANNAPSIAANHPNSLYGLTVATQTPLAILQILPQLIRPKYSAAQDQ